MEEALLKLFGIQTGKYWCEYIMGLDVVEKRCKRFNHLYLVLP